MLYSQEVEPWKKMLEGFKAPERHYFDTALDYLDWMNKSPNCPPSLKKQIDFQIAMLHRDAVEQNAPFLPRGEHTKRCRELLEKFLSTEPDTEQAEQDGELVFEALSTLGRLLMEKGREALLRTEFDALSDSTPNSVSDSASDDAAQARRLEARSEFQKALAYFEEADEWATTQAKQLREKRRTDKEAVQDAALRAAYGRFLTGKILIQLARSEIAKTYPKDAEEFRTGLEVVAEAFSKMASTYGAFPARFEAKLHAAKAYRDLGDFQTARSLLGELNMLRDNEFLNIRSESLKMALEMNLADGEPASLRDSISRIRGWEENAPAASKISRVGQEILLLGAKTFLAYTGSVKLKRDEHNQAIQDATALLRRVQPNFPNLAREATELLRISGQIRQKQAGKFCPSRGIRRRRMAKIRHSLRKISARISRQAGRMEKAAWRTGRPVRKFSELGPQHAGR